MNNSSPRQAPRMRDIAKVAGVSLGTVSRVINGKAEVAPELVERVMKAAQASGYKPRSARGPTRFQEDRLGPIGFLVDARTYSNINSEPFQAHFLSGIEKRARELGGHMVLACCRNIAERKEIPLMITDNLVKAVIIKCGMHIPQEWFTMISELVPSVLLMHRTKESTIPSVMCDNFGGMHNVLRYLRELGHRRVGYFCEDDGAVMSPHHIERENAFKDLRSDFGLELDPRLVQCPTRQPGESYDELIHRTIRTFLELGKDRPTAIVCAADVYGLSFNTFLPSYGISVPRDISLVGFMNTHRCDTATPPLTSVSLLEDELGQAAVDLLAHRIQNPDSAARHLIIGTRLVERLSCAPPRLISK